MISDPELGVLVLKCFTVVQALGWMLANQGGPLRNIGRRLPGEVGWVPFGRDRGRGLCSIVLYFTGDEAWGVGSAREVMALDCWP
jgi:hypothetical protein